MFVDFVCLKQYLLNLVIRNHILEVMGTANGLGQTFPLQIEPSLSLVQIGHKLLRFTKMLQFNESMNI